MASLPPLPKELRSVGSSTKEEQARRVDEWARALQQLVGSLRANNPEVLRRLDELEADVAAGTGGGGVSDHGALTGLADDDHTQYLLTDGTRALTGDQSAGAHKITNLAASTTNGDAVRHEDSRLSDDRTASGLRTATTVVTVSAAAAPSSGDILVATAANAAQWQAPGLTALPILFREPRAKPASAHADDNEFDTSIADFTTWDFGSYQTRTLVTASKRMEISGTGNAAVRWGGLYKNVPAGGEYSIVLHCGYSASAASQVAVGLAAFQDATNSGGDFRNIRIGNGTLAQGPLIVTDTLSAYNGTSSAITSGSVGAHFPWLRMRINGTTCATDYSADGETWLLLASVTLGFTPAQVGPIFEVLPASAATGYFYSWRVKSGAGSSAFDFNQPGRVVRVGS